MYCYRCGQRLADSARHCPNCGAAIFYNENGPISGTDGKDCDACAEESFGSAYSTHDPYKTDTGSGDGRSDGYYHYDPETGSYRSSGDGYSTDPYGNQTGGSSYQYGGHAQPGSSYQYGPGGSYSQPGPGRYPAAPTKEDGFALASLICAIASVVTCCVPYIGLPAAIGAVVLGILGRSSVQRKSLAIFGLVLGIIMAVINGVMLAVTLYYVAHPDLMQELMDQMQLYMEDVPTSGAFPIQ